MTTLIASCATVAPSATAELCRQWRDAMPTAVAADTAETKRQILAERLVFERLCPGQVTW